MEESGRSRRPQQGRRGPARLSRRFLRAVARNSSNPAKPENLEWSPWCLLIPKSFRIPCVVAESRRADAPARTQNWFSPPAASNAILPPAIEGISLVVGGRRSLSVFAEWHR